MFSEAPDSEQQQGELIDALQEWKSAKYQEIIGMPDTCIDKLAIQQPDINQTFTSLVSQRTEPSKCHGSLIHDHTVGFCVSALKFGIIGPA